MPLDSMNWSAPPITETDETTALLILARSLVERGWCREALARDRKGRWVHPTAGSAVAWCASGALIAAAGAAFDLCWLPASNRLEAAIGGEDICIFNNRQESVEPVLAAFDRAIAGEPPARIARED
jgi:hypothetical protein